MRTGMSREAIANREYVVSMIGVLLFALSFLRTICASLVKPISDFRLLISGFGVLLLAMWSPFPGSSFSAERIKPIRIGVLTDSWGPTPGVVGLRDGLKELGYREGRDFVIGVRFTQGDIAALPEAARELVKQGVDILFTNNPAPAKAAQMATNRIPIVF